MIWVHDILEAHKKHINNAQLHIKKSKDRRYTNQKVADRDENWVKF